MSDAYNLVPSPVGTLKLVASPHGLVALLWPDDNPNRVVLGELSFDPAHAILREAETSLVNTSLAHERPSTCRSKCGARHSRGGSGRR